MSNNQGRYMRNIQNSQSTNSLTHLLSIKKYFDNKNLQDLENYLSQEQVSPECLNNCLSNSIYAYTKDKRYILKFIDLFLRYGANPNISIRYPNPKILEKSQITPSMLAIALKDIEFLMVILKHKPNLRSRDSKDRNVLFYFLIYGNDNINILNLLISSNADLESDATVEMSKGYYEKHSVFTLACFNNHVKTVKVLMDNYVNVNYRIPQTGDTALHIAVRYEYVDLAKMLLDNRVVNSNIYNDEKERAIDVAKKKGGEIYEVFIAYENKKIIENSYQSGNSDIKENNYINKEDIEELKRKLSCNVVRKVKIQTNLEIPIEFNNDKIMDKYLGSFVSK